MTSARPRYVSQQTLADELGVSVRTIRRQLRAGAIPGWRVGRQIRIREEDLPGLLTPVQTGPGA